MYNILYKEEENQQQSLYTKIIWLRLSQKNLNERNKEMTREYLIELLQEGKTIQFLEWDEDIKENFIISIKDVNGELAMTGISDESGIEVHYVFVQNYEREPVVSEIARDIPDNYEVI